MTSIFDHYGPVKAGDVVSRQNGVLVSMVNGKTLAYALFTLQDRGRLFLGHGVDIYEGQVVGIHSRDNDLAVEPHQRQTVDQYSRRGHRRSVNSDSTNQAHSGTGAGIY